MNRGMGLFAVLAAASLSGVLVDSGDRRDVLRDDDFPPLPPMEKKPSPRGKRHPTPKRYDRNPGTVVRPQSTPFTRYKSQSASLMRMLRKARSR